MVCDAYLRVNLCKTLLKLVWKVPWPISALWVKRPSGKWPSAKLQTAKRQTAKRQTTQSALMGHGNHDSVAELLMEILYTNGVDCNLTNLSSIRCVPVQ